MLISHQDSNGSPLIIASFILYLFCLLEHVTLLITLTPLVSKFEPYMEKGVHEREKSKNENLLVWLTKKLNKEKCLLS